MYCPKCGKELPDRSGFCAFCGEAQASPQALELNDARPARQKRALKYKRSWLLPLLGVAILLVVVTAVAGLGVRKSGGSDELTDLMTRGLSEQETIILVAYKEAAVNRPDTRSLANMEGEIYLLANGTIPEKSYSVFSIDSIHNNRTSEAHEEAIRLYEYIGGLNYEKYPYGTKTEKEMLRNFEELLEGRIEIYAACEANYKMFYSAFGEATRNFSTKDNDTFNYNKDAADALMQSGEKRRSATEKIIDAYTYYFDELRYFYANNKNSFTQEEVAQGKGEEYLNKSQAVHTAVNERVDALGYDIAVWQAMYFGEATPSLQDALLVEDITELLSRWNDRAYRGGQ